MNSTRTLYPSIARLALATGFLLLIPLVVMQFTGEVDWTLFDFVVAGGLLFGTGLTYLLVTRVLATRTAENLGYRIAVGVALFTGLLLLWVNGAVGIIGSEDNPTNLMYFGVIAVGLIGAFLARFRPKGLARTMLAMALAQALVAVIALIAGMHHSPVSPLTEILGANGFFIVLFVVSALLFQYAAKKQQLTSD